MANDALHRAPTTSPERFPEGKFAVGQWVRLHAPDECRASFDNPGGPLQVVAKNWFRRYEGPSYALAEPGGIAVVPFRDSDLSPAHAPAAGQAALAG